MYSAVVYNYFNSGKRARKSKCRKGIPISKPSKNKQMKKCKLCGRKFLRAQCKHDKGDNENKTQPGSIVYEKVFLVWKYSKNILSNTIQKNNPQKCSFKIITHKSYKKRSLHQEIVSTSTSILSHICKICEKHKIQKNKSKELKAEEHVPNKNKSNGKKKKRKHRKPRLIWSYIQHNRLGDKTFTAKNLAFKKLASGKKLLKKQNRGRTFLPKMKFNTNKKERMFIKENRKKVNRFASWKYMQHALSSVGEETIINYVNEDKTPVYLTFEEYCLILGAINTRGDTADKFNGGDFDRNIEEITESSDTNTSQLNISTEDAATNTDLLIFEHIGNTSTNTEQREFSEEVATNTKAVNKITEKLILITEQPKKTEVSQITETLDTINDPSSEATEEFDTNTDEPSDTILHFKTNGENPSKENLIINMEVLNKLHKKTLHEANEISKQLNDIDENSLEFSNTEEIKEKLNIHKERNENEDELSSLDDINEIGQSDTTLLSEEIEKVENTNDEGMEQTEESNEGDQLKEQIELPEDFLDNTRNQQDKIVENTCSEKGAEGREN